MNEQKVRPIRKLKVIDVLIVGLVKQLPSYYSRCNKAKFVCNGTLYYHVSDSNVIRHFEFKSEEQREHFIHEWKSLCNHNKP